MGGGRPWILFGVGLVVAACDGRPLIRVTEAPRGTTVLRLRVDRVDKLDLLVVVDNAPSMADAQAELARRLPELLAKAIDPAPYPGTAISTGVVDVHVGVITSSLGSLGTSACAPAVTTPENDDRAHLLPRPGESGGAGCTAPIEASPLTWVFDPARDPTRFSGAEGVGSLAKATTCVVQSAKATGCGFAQPWEALYRFLVDPAPYAKAGASCTFGVLGDACVGDVVVDGVDETLLAERRAFLRDDSLVAIVLLSDTNDVSLRPSGQSWRLLSPGAGSMPRGTAACATLPDDVDRPADLVARGCRSCLEAPDDPACARPWDAGDPDAKRLRGFEPWRRFGTSDLFTRDRYVNAFKSASVPDAKGVLGPNPLYAGGFRDQSLVVVAGIVGVPRELVQDGGKPKLLRSADWEKILSPDLEKRDPHMIESIAPRAGVPRFAGDRSIDDVHGGDRDVPDGDDLQYACIAPRLADASGALDCTALGGDASKKSPLCDASGKQTHRKAYPGLRHLRILERLGASAFVASICNESFAPAIQGIADKLRAATNVQCLPMISTPSEGAGAGCAIIEVLDPARFAGKTCETLTGSGHDTGYCTPGSEACPRAHPSLPLSIVGADGRARLEDVRVGVEGGNVIARGSDGKSRLVCEVLELAGGRVDPSVTKACVEDPKFTLGSGGGFCLSSVRTRPADLCGPGPFLRFLGDAQPKSGSQHFAVCSP